MEGFYAKLARPDIPERDHHPGDICDGPFAHAQPGYSGYNGRLATFATDDARLRRRAQAAGGARVPRQNHRRGCRQVRAAKREQH